MEQDDIRCAHTCRNSCAMLNEAMRREQALVQFYETLRSQCDYPDVNAFLQQLIEARSASILQIVQKLNELRARTQIIDGLMSSFDPAGC